MALASPIVVRVEKQPEGSFGETMNVIRFWLDHCKIQPVSFKPVANARPQLAWIVTYAAVKRRAIMHPPGSNLRSRRRHSGVGRGVRKRKAEMTAGDRFDLERFATA